MRRVATIRAQHLRTTSTARDTRRSGIPSAMTILYRQTGTLRTRRDDRRDDAQSTNDWTANPRVDDRDECSSRTIQRTLQRHWYRCVVRDRKQVGTFVLKNEANSLLTDDLTCARLPAPEHDSQSHNNMEVSSAEFFSCIAVDWRFELCFSPRKERTIL